MKTLKLQPKSPLFAFLLFAPIQAHAITSEAAPVLSQRVELTQLKAACASLLHAIESQESETGNAENWEDALSEVLSEAQNTLTTTNYLPARSTVSAFSSRRDLLNQSRVTRAIAILNEDLENPPTLEELGQKVGCSPYYLSRIFTEITGKTLSTTLRDLRIERAALLLSEGRLNVTEVALEVGYSSLSHFSSAFREKMGCSPKDYPVLSSQPQSRK